MGMRRWSLHFALVLPFFLLGFGLEVKKEQVPEGPIDPATIEIDENLVGLLLAECGLEWIYLKPFYDTSDLSLVVTSGSTGAQNNGNDILKKKHVQKFLNNLPPDAQKKLFDCLSRKGLIALLSKYDASSSGWFLKRPQPTQSRRYLATVEQSGGDSGTTIIVAVVITAVVTFFLAFLVFLCFFKTNDSKDDDDKSLRISSPGDPGDSEKLYSTGLSIKDFDVPPFDTNKISSKKSYATGLSIKNFKASRKSYATELSSKNFEDPPPCDTNKISSKKSYACGLSIKNFRASRKSYATELSNKNFEASRKSYATGLSNKNFEASRKSDATGLSINNVEDGNAPIPPLKPPPGRVASSLKGDLPSSKPLGRVRSFLPEPPAFLSKFLSPAAPPPEPPQPPSSEPSGAPAPPPPPPSTAPAAPPPPPAPGGKPGVAPPPPPPRGGVPPPPRPGVPPPPRPGGGPPRPPTTNAADASKAKLKPFFWDKVVTNPEHQMVWHQIKAGSFEYNEEMIESLFGCVPTDKNKKDEKKPPKDPPARLVQLIDAKKAQNLSILLRALNVTTEEVRDALEHGNELCPELLETLLKMSPTQEEELKLRLYTGDLSQIGPAERFLKALVDIPFFYKRLEALHFMGTLQEEATNVRDSFAVLEAACDELRNSRLFLKLLEAVLKTGNRMNSGTFRGGAQAFKLDTLLKLSDVKGTDGKTTLLHFVVLEIIRSEGIRAARTIKESGSFSSVKSDELDVDVKAIDSEEQLRNLGLQVVSSLGGQLENVKKAASLDADVLTTTASKLGNSLVKTKTFLNTEMKEVEEENGFHQVLKCFVEHAQAEVTQILEEEKKIMGLVKSTGDYFHGTPGKEEGLRLFSVVRDFLVILERACREVAEKFKKESASKAQNKEGQAESAKRPPLKKKCSSKKRSVASSTQQQQKQPIASSIEGSKDPPPQKQQPSSATNGSEKSPQQPPPSSSGKLAESSHRKQTSSMESLDDVCNRLFPIMKEMKMSDNTSSSSDDYSSDENSEPSLRGRSTQSPKQQQASLKDAPTEPSQSYLDFHERLFPKIQDMMSDEDSLSSYDSSSDDDDKSSSIVGSLRSLSQLSSSKDSPAAEPPLKDASIESSPRSSADVHAVIRGMRIAGGDSCSDEDREEPSSSSKNGSMKSSFALLQEPSTGPGNVNAISGLQQPSISKDGSTKLHDGLPLLTIKEFNTGGDSSTSPASSSDKDNKHSSPREEGSRKSPSQLQDPCSSEESAELSFQQQQQPLSEHVLTEPSYSSPDVDESLHPTIKNMSTSGSTSSSNDGHQPSSNERSSELATQLQPPSPSREGHLKPPLQQQQPSYTSYDSSSDEDNKPSSSREISKDSQQQSSSSSSSGEQPSEPSPELQQPLSADGSLKSPRPSLGVHEEVRPTIKDIRIGGDPSLDEDSKPSPKEGDAESLSQQVSSSRQEHSGTSSQQQHSPPKDGSTDSPCPFSNAREQLFPTTKDVRVDSNSNSSDDSCSNKNLEPSPSSEWSTELSPQHQQPSSLEELEHAKSISPQSSSSSEGLVQTFDTRISGELNPPSSASLYQDHKPSSSGEEYVESISKRDPPFLREEPTEPSSEQQQSFPLDGLTGSLSSSLDVS